MSQTDIVIRHKKDGTPYVRLYLGTNKVTGRPVKPYREFRGMTDQQALKAAQVWLHEKYGGYLKGDVLTFGMHLQRYISYLESDGRSHNTVKAYKTFLGYCDRIANMSIRDVTPIILNDLYSMLLKYGWTDKPLSHTTVYEFRMFLQGAFNHFVDTGLVSENPVRKSMKIFPQTREAEALDEESLRLVSEWIDSAMTESADTINGIHRRNVAFAMYIALYTGARAGEVCALRRCDIRMASKTMSINGNVVRSDDGVIRQDMTKGKKTRNVTIQERLVQPLRDHMRWQDGYLIRHNAKTPIITKDGSFADPAVLSRGFASMRRELGLSSGCTFHTLRHTHATWLLQGGCDMRTVQERLGHTRVNTTLSLYSHVLPGRDEQAAEGFGRIMDSVTGNPLVD